MFYGVRDARRHGQVIGRFDRKHLMKLSTRVHVDVAVDN